MPVGYEALKLATNEAVVYASMKELCADLPFRPDAVKVGMTNGTEVSGYKFKVVQRPSKKRLTPSVLKNVKITIDPVLLEQVAEQAATEGIKTNDALINLLEEAIMAHFAKAALETGTA